MRCIAYSIRLLVLAIAGLSITLVSFDTSAHGPSRGRVGVGVHIGVPGPIFWGPRHYYGGPRHFYGGPTYYYPPAYYYGAPAIVEQAPVYVERGSSDPAAAATQPTAPPEWYFCADPEGYYPYVNQCPGGWRKVPAQPPANPQ